MDDWKEVKQYGYPPDGNYIFTLAPYHKNIVKSVISMGQVFFEGSRGFVDVELALNESDRYKNK